MLRRAEPVRWLLLANAVIGTLRALSVVLIAGCIAAAVGGVVAERELQPAVAVLPWLASGFVARAALTWVGDLIAVRAAIAVKSQFRREVAAAYLRPEVQQPDRGTVTSLITTGLDDLDGYFSRYLPQLVLAVTVPLVVGVAIAIPDPLSAVIVALTLPLIPVFMILVGWTTEKLTGRRWQVQARLAHHFADLIAGLPTLRVFGRARAQAEGLRRSGEANRAETLATLRIALLSALVLELLAALSVAIVAVVIGLRVLAGDVDLTTALFVLILAPEAYLPLRQVGVHYHDGASGAAAAQSALDLIEAAEQPEQTGRSSDSARTSTGSGSRAAAMSVRCREVGFGYPGSPRPVLDRFDLDLEPGRITVLTGPSGSGKSTVLAMIMGWVVPDSGRVLVDGPRRRIAWVGQEPALLRGTVADNVRLGLPGADDDQIRQALRAAGLDLAPDRQLDESLRLSAGEVRRLALARAWLPVRFGEAEVMLLDEPTAGLDEATEVDAIAAVRDLGSTVLLVSHRPAVLAAADRVIRLEQQ